MRLLTWIHNHWLPVTLFILLAITVSSLVPLAQMQKISVPFSDKTHHFVAYASLMFPVALRRPKGWWLIALAFVGYSGVIELLQPLVNRSNEWLDLLANGCGVTIGAVLGAFFSLTNKMKIQGLT